MLKLFLKKKKLLSSGSALTKCETGVTLNLLISISSEFLLSNKKNFLSKLRIFSFISKKKIQSFETYLSSYKIFKHYYTVVIFDQKGLN